MLSTSSISFAERAERSQHPLSKKLFELMEKKKSNLCFNPDVSTSEEFLKLADQVGPEICVLKTHVDLLQDFSIEVTEKLEELATKHDFLIFEDRKFVDIGSVVKAQYDGGVYRIAHWSHITNATPLAGPGIVEGLKQVGLPKGRGLLLLAEMSSKGTLTDEDYIGHCVELAKANPDFVMGFITQHQLTDPAEHPDLIHFSPGVKLVKGGDGLGQQYRTPRDAIVDQGCDVVIVGRGIYQAENPQETAAQYREAAWNAYLER